MIADIDDREYWLREDCPVSRPCHYTLCPYSLGASGECRLDLDRAPDTIGQATRTRAARAVRSLRLAVIASE